MSHNWEIVFYKTSSGRKPVQEFVDNLAVKDKAKINWSIDLLRKYGMSLQRPYLAHLKNKIWELRAGKYRVFLSHLLELNILLIHIIMKKKQKIPKQDLKLAESRLKEYLN
jgi:phage-related protein